MDLETAQRLAALTGAFYASVSESFSATRAVPWHGWRHVLDEIATPSERTCLEAEEGRAQLVPGDDKRHGKDDGRLRVLDLACGNYRFERYLDQALVSAGWSCADVCAIDSCDALAAMPELQHIRVSYRHLDVLQELFDGRDPVASACRQDQDCWQGDPRFDLQTAQDFDLLVCFGFMHHVPLREHRSALMRSLVQASAPGAVLAISFWQLGKSERILRKARAVTAEAAPKLGLQGLETGDYLLDWQGRTDVYRYCHDFSEAELDELTEAVAGRAVEVARFSSDGASGDLNRYLLWRVR